jgi:hypothetical protein
VWAGRKTHGKEATTVTMPKTHGKGVAHGTNSKIHTAKICTRQRNNMAHGKEKKHGKEVDTWPSRPHVTEPLQ